MLTKWPYGVNFKPQLSATSDLIRTYTILDSTVIWCIFIYFTPHTIYFEATVSLVLGSSHSGRGKMSARTDAEAEQNQHTSGITPDTLSTTLKEKLDAVHVDIVDLSGMADREAIKSKGSSVSET